MKIEKRSPPEGDICECIAHNCKHFRQQRGWTQGELNARCGFERDFIRVIEEGMADVTLAQLEKLSGVLTCTAEALLWPLNWSCRQPKT